MTDPTSKPETTIYSRIAGEWAPKLVGSAGK